MAFDDHATVVALEFLVKELIARQCRESDNPAAEWQRWVRAMEGQKALLENFAFGPDRAVEPGSDGQVNAIYQMGEWDRLIVEFSEAVLPANDLT